MAEEPEKESAEPQSPKPFGSGAAPRDAAYTPRPEFDGKPKTARRLAPLAAAGLAAALGLGALKAWQGRSPGRPAERPAAEAQVQTGKVLKVGRAELDRAATAQARESLKRGETPPVLAQAGPELKRQVADGSMDLFSIRMVDTVAQDGDVVAIHIDGQPLGRVTLSHAGAVLTLPLKSGGSTELKVVAEADGGGGVTFGAVTSRGQAMSRDMRVGESVTWTVQGN